MTSVQEQRTTAKLFLEHFKIYHSTVQSLKIDSDKARFTGLLSGWTALDSAMTSYDKAVAASYNIFQLLTNIDNAEVTTHTPFIADLLNIHGKHKQGDLFYLEFLQQLQLPNIRAFIPDRKIHFAVDAPKSIGLIDEDYCQGGSIDILIHYHDGNKQFAIAIENKRSAPDQRNQLQRYYNYLKNVHKVSFLLVYLSLDGRPPSAYSINEHSLRKYVDRGEVKVIGYKKEIRDLLANTINKVEAQNVRSLVSQYSAII